MRISYFLIAFSDSGSSQVLYKFMDTLCERGHEVFAITPTGRIQWQKNHSKTFLQSLVSSRNKKPNPYQVPGSAVSPVKKLMRKVISGSQAPAQNIADYLSWLVQGLLRHWIQSDITISTFCNTSYANYALMDKTVPVYHMQHYEEIFMEEEASLKAARLTYFLPLVLVANSTWLQNQIRTRVGREPYILNPGIDTKLFSPRESIPNKYSNPSRITILSYYSPLKSKAWDDAVEAMNLVFKKVPRHRIEWVVFGGVPPVVPNLPVQFVGKVYGESLAQLYSKAHLCFANSWHDSFPLPPLEAMACGTSVVTTRLGTEDYALDEENSLVIPPRKPELLANSILRLMDDLKLASSLAEAGVSTASRFAWDLAGTRLEQILLEALNYPPGKKFSDIPLLASGLLHSTP